MLDPRNIEWLTETAETYGMLRQFPAALKTFDRVLDIVPNDPNTVAFEAEIYQAPGQLGTSREIAGWRKRRDPFVSCLPNEDEPIVSRAAIR